MHNAVCRLNALGVAGLSALFRAHQEIPVDETCDQNKEETREPVSLVWTREGAFSVRAASLFASKAGKQRAGSGPTARPTRRELTTEANDNN